MKSIAIGHCRSFSVWSGISALLGIAAPSPAAVHFFVNNPTANSTDFAAACAARGLPVNRTIDFATHPEGAVVPTWFQASSGVVISTGGTTSVNTGDGSLSGNTLDPGGVGEGVMPEPARYLATGGAPPTTVEFTFDRPVSGFGVMTADMFQWGGATPSATIEAFDAAGGLIDGSPSINTSFEFDYLYFMGVIDDDARISRIRFTNNGISGDSIYLTQVWFARVHACPCPADFDDGTGTGTCDGGVGIEDLLYYLGQYNAGVTRADVDDGSGTGTPDGGVGIEDLLYYLGRYNAGC